jgi:hypothetical protein
MQQDKGSDGMKDTTVERIVVWIMNNLASDDYRQHVDTVMTLGEAELQNRAIEAARRRGIPYNASTFK